MTVIDFPQGLLPDSEEWRLRANTREFKADLNGAIQTAELPGSRWEARLTFTNRFGKPARKLQGFVTGLKGRAGRFWMTPADWEPLGNPEGVGVVSQDTESGSSLSTSGWTADILELFCAGDYFEVNGELKKLTSDIDSDVNGEAVLHFGPPLRKPVTTGMSIRVNEPRCKMMLADDNQAAWSTSSPVIYASTISAVEALDI